MDERVEEIGLISPILPVRKVALVRRRRGRREPMYQLNEEMQKSKKIGTKKIPRISQSAGASAVADLNDYAADLKKRIAFDRARIIGD